MIKSLKKIRKRIMRGRAIVRAADKPFEPRALALAKLGNINPSFRACNDGGNGLKNNGFNGIELRMITSRVL
jgi:hypothetical protein